jgi:hypothetical protein
MVRRLVLVVLVATAVSASWNCGSTPQVGGDWSGGVRPTHLDVLQIRLTQDDRTIRGTACYLIGNGVPPTVVFRDATVTGSYPTIRVAASNGWTFEGEFQDDILTGRYYNSGTGPEGYPMYLTRGVSSVASCITP